MTSPISPMRLIERYVFGIHAKTKRSLAEEVESGDDEATKTWIRDGVNPNEVDAYGYTPLLNACAVGRLSAVNELIKNGADVNKKGQYGFTPLHAAAQNGHRDLVLELLKHGASVNAQNDDLDTPMHLAIRSLRLDIINILLNHSSDPSIQGFHNKDCIQTAYECNLLDLAELMEKSKSNLNKSSDEMMLQSSLN